MEGLKMKSLKKIFLLLALTGLLASSASAQACYTTFSGANTYFDAQASYPANVAFTSPFVYSMTFPVNNRIKTGGITMHWRYSTDAVTVQRAITTIPGYKTFTKSGEGTASGKGNLYMNKFTKKGTYFISYKFATQRGDVLTAIYKITIT